MKTTRFTKACCLLLLLAAAACCCLLLVNLPLKREENSHVKIIVPSCREAQRVPGDPEDIILRHVGSQARPKFSNWAEKLWTNALFRRNTCFIYKTQWNLRVRGRNIYFYAAECNAQTRLWDAQTLCFLRFCWLLHVEVQKWLFSARTHRYAPFGAALASRRVGQPLQTQILPSNVQL